jgi:hypothetical protein
MTTPVLPELKPERQNQVNNNGRTKRQKGCVDKIEANATGRKTQLLSQFGTNTKNVVFDKIADSGIHKPSDKFSKNLCCLYLQNRFIAPFFKSTY